MHSMQQRNLTCHTLHVQAHDLQLQLSKTPRRSPCTPQLSLSQHAVVNDSIAPSLAHALHLASTNKSRSRSRSRSSRSSRSRSSSSSSGSSSRQFTDDSNSQHVDSASSSTQESTAAPRAYGDVDTTASAADCGSLPTLAEVQAAAAARGLDISLKTLGPLYRVTCRDGGPQGRILGVTNGFVAPWFGLMHCDTLQIFTRGLKGAEGERVRRNALGLGLLLGGAVFSYGLSCGCTKAEILAINDDDAWHERLVRYYSYFGFKPVCKVGGQGLADIPHLLVWGGEGTRMDADIPASLRRWTRALRQGAPLGTRPQRSASVAAAAEDGL